MSNSLNTSVTILSTHVESKEWISSSQLTLSSSLKNFCKDAFNGYFLAGMTMGRAAGIVMKCESFSIFSRFFGNSWGTKALAGGMGLAMEGTLFHIAPQVLERGEFIREGAFLGSLNSSLTILACQIAIKGAPPNRVIREVTMNCSIMSMEAMTQLVGISDQVVPHASLLDWYLSSQLASIRVQVGSHLVAQGLPHIGRREGRTNLSYEIDRAGEPFDKAQGKQANPSPETILFSYTKLMRQLKVSDIRKTRV